jgi:hypothetical protein
MLSCNAAIASFRIPAGDRVGDGTSYDLAITLSLALPRSFSVWT